MPLQVKLTVGQAHAVDGEGLCVEVDLPAVRLQGGQLDPSQQCKPGAVEVGQRDAVLRTQGDIGVAQRQAGDLVLAGGLHPAGIEQACPVMGCGQFGTGIRQGDGCYGQS